MTVAFSPDGVTGDVWAEAVAAFPRIKNLLLNGGVATTSARPFEGTATTAEVTVMGVSYFRCTSRAGSDRAIIFRSCALTQ